MITRRLQAIAMIQALAGAMLLLGADGAFAASVGSPGGGNRNPINFVAGSPFSRSTWTSAHNAHIPGIANGQGLPKHGFSLDLDSTSQNITLSRGLIGRRQEVTIDVGGLPMTFGKNDHVTAAQFIAILQVLPRNGVQTLEIDSNGAATGGTFSLNKLISPRITGLEIPENVIAFDNIARNPLMGLSGPLTNNGTIYAYSTSRRIHTGVIYAADYAGNGGNIFNNGLISTQVPADVLPAGVNPIGNISFILAADNDIVNTGMIMGTNNLKFATAYGTIQNIPAPGGPTPIIQAVGNISLLPGAETKNTPLVATIINQGTITSAAGNITINTPVYAADLVINGTGGGVMQAYSGAINVRDIKYKGAGNILINGGSYEAPGGFNLMSGSGNIIANSANHLLDSVAPTGSFLASILSTKTTGAVDLVNDTTTGITVLGSTAGSFALAGGGSTLLTSIVTSSGDLTVTAAGGTLSTVPGARLASAGDLTLQNLDEVAGKLVIGTGSSLSTGGANAGAITLAVQAGAVTPTNGSTNPSIANVLVDNNSGNSIFLGEFGLTAYPPTNTLALNGQDIVLGTTTGTGEGADAITLNGFVNVSAGAYLPVMDVQKAPLFEEIIVDSGEDAE